MGPLIEGTPLRWDDIKGPVAEKIRSLAVHQFMRQWRNRNNCVNKQPIWGDEVSFTETPISNSSPKFLPNYKSESQSNNSYSFKQLICTSFKQILETFHCINKNSLNINEGTDCNESIFQPSVQ